MRIVKAMDDGMSRMTTQIKSYYSLCVRKYVWDV